MLLFLSILGIFLSGLLIYYNARNKPSTVYMGLFFILISIYTLIYYILFYSESVFLISIVFVNFTFITYLTGPVLYWYVRSTLKDDHHLKKSDVWHLVPAVVFLISALPYLFSPFSYKVEMANNVINDRGFLQLYQSTVLYRIFGTPAIFFSRPVIFAGYTIWSFALLFRFLRQKSDAGIFRGQNFMIKWLILLLGFFLLLVVSHTLSIAVATVNKNMVIFFSLNVLQILSGVGLIGLLLSPFFSPEILYGMPRHPDVVKKNGHEPDLTEIPSRTHRQHIPEFNSSYFQLISHKTDECMRQFKPYLQPDFNLVRMSVMVEIPVHHLGYYFKNVKNQHFRDYCNCWRIAYAKNLMAEKKTQEMTLEAIGLIAGFPNRDAFRIAFQRSEGVTPADFANREKQ